MNRDHLILEILDRYRQSGRSLNEFQRRHWAATEAMKLGRGGIAIVSKALRISPNTIKRGIQEISSGQTSALSQESTRIRKPGGGRKSKATAAERLARTRTKKTNAQETCSEHPAADSGEFNQHEITSNAIDSESIPATDSVPVISPPSQELR